MDTTFRPGDADPGPGRPAGAGDLVPDDGVEVEPDRPDEDDDSDVPWAPIAVLVLVLATGAFAAGWHFGRRWGRLMGW